MFAGAHSRGLPITTADANADAPATAASLVVVVLGAVLRAVRATGAFFCAMIRAAVAVMVALFSFMDPATAPPATASATVVANSPETAMHVVIMVVDERPITSQYATHNVLARRTAIDPNLPDIEVPAFLPGFDELLLPTPHVHPLSDVARARRFDFYAQSYFLQSHLARDRIREAYRERQRQAAAPASTTEPPLQDPTPYTSYACGCGWCPNGTAAYPLCAAVTVHRRIMACGGKRFFDSVAGDLSRHQNMCGHHDATAVFDGSTRG